MPEPAFTVKVNKPGAAHFHDQIAWFTQGQHRPVLNLEAVAGGQVAVDALPAWVEFAIPVN